MRLSLLDSAVQTHAHMQKLILQNFKAVMPTLSGACCRSLLLFSFPLSNIKPEKVFCMQVKLLRNRAVKQREVERGQKRKWMMHLMHNIYNNPKHGRIMWSSTTMMKSQGEGVWDGSERRWGWESVCDLGVWHQTRWQCRKKFSHETNKPSEIEPPPPPTSFYPSSAVTVVFGGSNAQTKQSETKWRKDQMCMWGFFSS